MSIEQAAESLAEHARTARMQNSSEWIDELVARLNQYYEATGRRERVDAQGNGISYPERPDLRPAQTPFWRTR